MSRLQANLLLLLAGALWGVGFVAQSTAMAAIGPIQFIGFRFLVATLAMLPFALREGHGAKASLTASMWRVFVLIGVVMFAGMLTQQIGLLTTTVSNSGFLTGLYVVMVPFVGILLFREWPHRVVWPAAIMATAGIWLLSGGDISTLKTGDWLTILCAVFVAAEIVLIARFASHSGRPITLAVTQFALCAVLGLGLGLIFEPFDASALRAALPEILYTGIVSGGIAFTLQAVALRYTTAAQAAIFLSSEAVFAALFGALILGERLPATGLFGCALIFTAIVAVEALPPLLARRRQIKT